MVKTLGMATSGYWSFDSVTVDVMSEIDVAVELDPEITIEIEATEYDVTVEVDPVIIVEVEQQ